MSRADELLPIPDRSLPEEGIPGLELTDAHRAHLEIEERFIPGPANQPDVRVVITQPKSHVNSGGEKLPILLHFHGGAFCFMHPETFAGMEANWAQHHNCVVVSVDYRLAPEHKFPAALDDCLTVLDWVAANAAEIGGDPARIAIGGDSAGGNLAAAACQAARDKGGPAIVFQLLIYPATDFTADMTSPRSNAAGFGLSDVAIEWMRNCYLNDPFDTTDPRASPAMARDLSNLPPALIQTAEFDPLHDEGKAYADAMRAAGNTAIHINYPGMIHGFMRMGALVDDAALGISDAAKALRGMFEK